MLGAKKSLGIDREIFLYIRFAFYDIYDRFDNKVYHQNQNRNNRGILNLRLGFELIYHKRNRFVRGTRKERYG